MPSYKVKITSSDNIEFLVDYHIAMQSKTLALFLDTDQSFVENGKRAVQLPINSKYVKRIIEFMIYKYENQNNLAVAEFQISDDETMDLLEIASYLKI